MRRAKNPPGDVRCVLFDLDGTLVDSRRDIAAALDDALGEHGIAPVGVDRLAPLVGDGVSMLIRRALTLTEMPLDLESAVLPTYLEAYERRHLETTTAYDGVPETIEALAEREVAMAVVTNKPHGFSVSILEHLGMLRHMRVVIGGDSMVHRKPAPEPLLAAIAACDAVPAASVIVGDGDTDMQAGIAAGLYTIGVTYGFRSAEQLVDAGADVLIDRMNELTGLLERKEGPRISRI